MTQGVHCCRIVAQLLGVDVKTHWSLSALPMIFFLFDDPEDTHLPCDLAHMRRTICSIAIELSYLRSESSFEASTGILGPTRVLSFQT